MKCKSMMKKAAALALALMMCVTMLPTAAFAASAESAPWDGSIAESIPVNGDTYTISTPAQLAKLALDVNGGNDYNGKTVKLVADINLGGKEFTPIGSWANPFTGIFDGVKSATENYVISNVKISGDDTYFRAGLFGCVENSTVQNLTISNIEVTNSSSKNSASATDDANESATGAAVATLRSGHITNVHVIGTSTVSGHLRTGGIVGDIRGTESYVTNCVNEATVESDNLYTGGVVGAAHDVDRRGNKSGSVISGCTNKGKVTGTTNVGGIVGYADRATVENCTNEKSGVVTGRGNYGTGGIMGANVYNYSSLASIITSYYPTISSKIENCHNLGDVIGGRAGGILGAYIAAPGKEQPRSLLNCTIKDCSNTGTITGNAGKCGAIFGYQISYAKGDGADDVKNMGVIISGCTFQCDVNGVPATVATPSEISIAIS